MRQVGRIWLAPLLFASWSPIALADGPKPAPLARYFPAEDLVAYVEFDGIDAHADAWKKTAASKILNETTTGAMLESVARQLFSAIKLKANGFEFPSYDDLSAIARHMVRSGFAFGINRKPGDPKAKPSCIGLVLRGGAKGPLGPLLMKFLAMDGVDEHAIAPREATGGRKFRLFGAMAGPGVAWWAEGDDLAFAILEGRYVETMIGALDGKITNAVEHPLRKELIAPGDGFEPVGLGFLDAKALPPLPTEAVLFGLDGINRVDVRWGYHGEALESVTRVVAPSPRKGVLALFDQPTFDSKILPPRPAGVGSFAASSVDLGATLDKLRDLLRRADPVLGPAFEGFVQMFEDGTGKKLRDDVLSRFGPRLLLADVPTRMLVPTAPFDAMARGMARVPRLSLLIEIKDRPRLIEDLEALAKCANEQFPPPKGEGGKPAPSLVRRLKGAELGYEIALSPTYWPFPAGYRPSMVIGERFLSLGTTPEVARQALRTGVEADPPMTRALAGLPSDLTLLSVTDTPNSALPELLANVPSVIQWWAFVIQGFAMNSGIQVAATPPSIAAPAPVEPINAAPSRLEVKPDGTLAAVGEPIAPISPLPEPPGKLVTKPDGTLALVSQPRTQAPAAPVAPVAPAPAASTLPTMLIRLRLDPDEIPDPEQIRPLLFPATYALSVDAQGLRFTSREAFPAWNPTGLVPLAVAAVLPGVQERRASIEKGRETANLRKINQALEKYQETNGHSPARATLDKDGKPLLSWRVELLPFLGEQTLFDEFRRDEPWDSPANQKLIARIPAVFTHPTLKAEPGFTFVRGISDPEAKDRINQSTIIDESMGDASLGDAGRPVPWTKPEADLSIELDPSLVRRPAPRARPRVVQPPGVPSPG